MATVCRIACIIPVHNGERHLAAALDSVAAQTVRVDEVIVVDDRSYDRSAAIAAAHPLAPLIVPSDGAGPGHARNSGIRASHCDLIAFLDADDLWLPGKTAMQLARLTQCDRPDLVYDAYENFADDLPDDGRSALLGPVTGYLQLSTTMLRRAMIDQIGGFDGSLYPYGEDNDLLMRIIAAQGVIARSDTIVARRRLHAGNLTRAFDNDARMDIGFDLIRRQMARNRSRTDAPDARGGPDA